MKKTFLPWLYIKVAIDKLSKQIKESGVEINYIYGIPRGGLIPAVMLSHTLNIPLTNLTWTPGINPINDMRTLVVDEICDSGNTLKKYIHAGCLTLSIHYKKSAIVTPDFYCDEITDNEFIYYPWERTDAEPIADYLK
jgi:hypoxanthine phosphoribosyltransferase